MKEILKHMAAKLFYALGWSIDAIVITIVNFLICIPVTLCVWIFKRYWNPIRRNFNKAFQNSDDAFMCVIASLLMDFIIVVFVGVLIFACINFGCVTVMCGIFGFLCIITFLIICFFAYAEYKETTLDK